jgi:protein O-GlcNAc transferase
MTEAKQILDLATRHHQAGRLSEAEALYRQVADEQPSNADALHRLGIIALQTKRPEQAIEQLMRAIALKPAAPNYHWALGQAMFALRRTEEAIGEYQRALKLGPQIAPILFDLGVALQAIGRADDAIAAYERAIALRDDAVEARINLGNALHSQNRFEEAAAAYRRAIEIRPDSAEAYNNLSSALQSLGRVDEAIAAVRRSLELNPDHPPALNNLGTSLQTRGEVAEATVILRRALELRPNFPEAEYNLANALWMSGEFDAAIAGYRRAVALKPSYVAAYNNLGNSLRSMGDLAGSEAAYRTALKHRPNYAEAQNNLGTVLRMRGRITEALAAYQTALSLRPNTASIHSNLANVFKDIGELDRAIASYRHATNLSPTDPVPHSNMVFTLMYHPQYDAQAILRECKLWNERHAQPLRGQVRAHGNDRVSDRRLRIGYVSPDFRDHCQAFFTIPLLANHNHEEFEVFCYAAVPKLDSVSERLRGYADVWRNTARINDAKVADLVRADGIDILVDLTMHMGFGRPLLFARKPAPVQVAWLAYPGTTGTETVDYRLTDPYLDPRGEHDADYSEQSIRLADTFWCYDPLTSEPKPNALPAVERGYVTFGCLNNFCKVNDRTLAMWAKVLAAVPKSRLVMLAPAGECRDKILSMLAPGADSSRIEFIERQARPEYLQTYHCIDIGLDTIPYNGHTTSLDSYWMGVPVVTLVGQTVVGRAGLSQLSNLELCELVGQTEEEFVRIAVTLAGDLDRLSELRRSLRERMERSPLMDGPRFAGNVESAYRLMWQKWCQASQDRQAAGQ